jgi:HK97 family phage major capsid protein
MVKSLAVARGDLFGARVDAEGKGASYRDVVESLVQMSAVTPLGTGDYAPPTPAAFDFAEFLRPLTVLGKLTGLRVAPARVRQISATSGSTAFWSGEKQPRPISRDTFAGATLELLGVTAILVVTNELLRSSAPSAQSLLSRDLAAANVAAMDSAFLDPANAGSAGIKPASITNGVTKIHSSGSTLAQIDSDLQILIQALSDAGSTLEFATWVLRPRTALYLSLLRGTGGALAYPGFSVKGGTLAGLPAVVSAASPSDVGSPAEGGSITLLDPSQILVADDGNTAVEVSKDAALAMVDNPSAPSSVVSLWQTESSALKVTRYANWQRCRAGMAQVLDQVMF